MKVSVVMPVWILVEGEKFISLTASALDSLGKVDEIFIVDNGSAEGSGWLKSRANTYLRFAYNKGFTPAINAGLQLAEGDIIAYVNNDIVAAPNWLDVCTKILENEEVATVHPMMLGAAEPFRFGTEVHPTGRERWCQGSFVVTTRRFLNSFKNSEWGKEPYPGLFDQNFGIGGGGDDWDWAFRIRKAGYKTAYTNRTCFQHHHSTSLKRLSNREEIARQNDEYFTQKWGEKKEDMMARLYPEQVAVDWKGGFV